MSEADWLACNDPQPMLEFLRDNASDRKLRLFACACCRTIWPSLIEEELRRSVEFSEKYAEGSVTAEQLSRVANVVYEMNFDDWNAAWVGASSRDSGFSSRSGAVWEASKQTVRPEGVSAKVELISGHPEGSPNECHRALVLDIFSNPFRPAVLNPAWLTWNGGTIPKLAQEIYDERQMPQGTLDNTRLPILADALEEAGCTNADILDHCRQPGTHVRGCWVVDLVLRKN
jgi:hypothetical protein